VESVKEDYAEEIARRAENDGLYETPSGMESIFMGTTRVIVQQAVLSPAVARRKVFLIGDAERMVPQEGKDEAANAFLKLLEEPPADTTVILTSSESGALLPTIRSRVVSFRAAPLDEASMRAFLAEESVQQRLRGSDAIPTGIDERLQFAAGAPGRLLSGESRALARKTAERMLAAATGSPLDAYQATWVQASSKARGGFADTLDALTEQLHHRARTSARRGAEREALAASRAVELVEEAKERVTTNVNPQLLTVNLIRDLQELLK
jgi:DNA polymerase-3 subunit delta'